MGVNNLNLSRRLKSVKLPHQVFERRVKQRFENHLCPRHSYDGRQMTVRLLAREGCTEMRVLLKVWSFVLDEIEGWINLG
jgi:hypothetical protein